jgi:hypothetical protein
VLGSALFATPLGCSYKRIIIEMKILFLVLFSSLVINAQDTYKEKNYDEIIYLYQLKCVEENNISKDDYLTFTKSLSKWETRPINLSNVWIMGELQPSSIVPNFFWGSFFRHYKVEIKDAMELPQIFLEKAKNERLKYIDDFSTKKEDYEKLISLTGKTDKKIFANQMNLKRVDNLFYENGKYWYYLIPEDSPYPMSDSTITIDNMDYEEIEINILDALEGLGIYALYKMKTLYIF